MRIDRRLSRDVLTERQLYFIECWSNFCHKNSPDTDRVGYSNPLSTIRELLFLYEMEDRFSADKKRLRVATELLDLLETDQVFKREAFKGIPAQLVSLLDRDLLVDPTRSPVEKRPRLICSLCVQLADITEASYITEALEMLEQELFSAHPLENSDAQEIYALTNGIMSVLLTRGMTLTECYLLYINIFRNVSAEPDSFQAVFHSFRQKLVTPTRHITVRMFITSEKLHTLLSTQGPTLEFNGCVFRPLDDARSRFSLSVDIPVCSMSDASARNMAGQMLRESLDVIAYMAGKGEISVQKQFIIIREEGETEVARFDNEIEANADRLTDEEFARFMVAMNRLFTDTSDVSRKKISSAFRFFRNGIESQVQESRFTAYWSALESLTLGVAPGTPSHEQHVISVVVPCMVLDYIVKQLFSLRQVLHFILREPGHSLRAEQVASLPLGQLYAFLKDTNRARELQVDLQRYPYVMYRVRKLAGICASPEKMADKLELHAKKVTRHLHRLYLLRNTIVHNAGTSPHIDLLTVNLEHYLRATISALFNVVVIHPTVSSAEEAFTRCQFTAESVFRELNPLHEITEKKAVAAIEKQLNERTLSRSDTCLIAWLNAHH
ncbi:hypothetical protein [Yersinia kristensenii]|uniref:hypothetical protein n=1 Tax=Yersinia kristensenii TaxID=28152 RepID=UPI000C1DF4EB|nr:hypothetical protein [Yersinia kristensenii]MDA5473521.1 hypothetical protein [Yersinia kristensenii]MDA5476417.1 hypothetical protein [Yersinia kristensenii]MDA5507717.1 hypothetical protein [Yersinia kristensenii]NIK95157.1 hypothetical protein [Yersinia kristensenii]NIL07153.1 hypothetical protein [Yersinia kristensenii]